MKLLFSGLKLRTSPFLSLVNLYRSILTEGESPKPLFFLNSPFVCVYVFSLLRKKDFLVLGSQGKVTRYTDRKTFRQLVSDRPLYPLERSVGSVPRHPVARLFDSASVL